MANDVAEIKIDKVFKPFPDSKTWKDGKKRGAIKSTDGIKFHVAETLLHEFKDGETCWIEYKKFGDKDNPGRDVVKKVAREGNQAASKFDTDDWKGTDVGRGLGTNGNGHAASNKDARITKLALSKLVAPIPFNPSAEVMADQMTAILQAAEIAFGRMFGDDIPF